MNRRGAPLDELYFKWLITPLDRKWDISFDEDTLRALYRIPFHYTVSNDQNRVSDGLYKREEFLTRHPVKSSSVELDGWLALECSVLEVLICLADRAAYQTGDTMADWLYSFLSNLGLHQSPPGSRIRRVIQTLTQRTYSSNGLGGLFPLKDPVEDQRQVELWYQMSAYIIENYEGRGADA